ncbi:MAG TPA: 50S ribosomal protein L9 [Acidimicrobiales bacterium]|nr:50S ribosomal protein L9 [Acidimicrobiales bacterium]
MVLRSDVSGLGSKGDVVEVADGYARNYLLPRKQALAATEGMLAQAEAMRRARQLKEARDREGAEALAERLAGAVVSVPARAGSEGRLFGSVTVSDLVAAVKETMGVELDRRRVELDEPIRSLGRHEVPVKLHPEVTARLQVDVVASS